MMTPTTLSSTSRRSKLAGLTDQDCTRAVAPRHFVPSIRRSSIAGYCACVTGLSLALVAALFASATAPNYLLAAEPAEPALTEGAAPQPEKQLFTGQVVMLPAALQERGIKSFDEMQDQVALETPCGELIPIVADWRGRAFFQDERLRDRKVE